MLKLCSNQSMIIALFTFWIILCGEWTMFQLIAACLSIIFIAFIETKLLPKIKLRINLYYIKAVICLFKDMLISTCYVMKIIWFNKEIEVNVEWVDNEGEGDFAKIAYANRITLTPSSMSMHLKDNKILVHKIKVKE